MSEMTSSLVETRQTIDMKTDNKPVLHGVQDYPSYDNVICVKYSNVGYDYTNNTTRISYKHCSFLEVTS